MDREQELEWLQAQKIVVSEDLVVAAKRQLQFLATIDRHRCLYDGPALHRAIFRYKTCWLPLLTKHTKSEIPEGPLVVPLDCEWIWHCHRLNPLRYKADCEEFYGRILDSKNVLSTTEGAPKEKAEEIWNMLYPEEPYELDLSNSFSNTTLDDPLEASEGVTYDLVAAVKRQTPFFYQVSRPAMCDDAFLKEAVARYKGFLHMIKRNKEMSIRRFCVPTYDIDLIWHSHQLHPVSYCKDLVKALGKVLEHDDTDSDRSKGQKLDVGFSGTTMQWERTFGTRYWRAGGMYKGAAPSPLTVFPCMTNIPSKTVVPSIDSQIRLQLSKITVMEVLLEVVGVKNLPEEHKGSLFLLFNKKASDVFLDGKRRVQILSESRQKEVASFRCEPTGELFFELMSDTPSRLGISKPPKPLGTTSVSIQNMLDPTPELSLEKWFELVPSSGTLDSKPIAMRIAISITTPTPAPHVVRMVQSRSVLRGTRFFPLPRHIKHTKGWTCVVDGAGNEIINLQMRNLKKVVAGNENVKREVVGRVGQSGEIHVLAKFSETGWSVMNSSRFSPTLNKSKQDGNIFELTGNRIVQLFLGRKLKYEPKSCQRQKNECDFVTAVEFSKEYPYGKEVALFNLKSGVLKIEEEWFVPSGITTAFILSAILRKEANNILAANGEKSEKVGLVKDVHGYDVQGKTEKERAEMVKEKGNDEYGDLAKNAAFVGSGNSRRNMVRSGACGSNCGNMVKSGGCGSSCGSGCGHMVITGGCSGSCGSGCGNMVMSGGCSSSCGSGCGHMIISGGCSGSCGSGCGNLVLSGGCSGSCGSGCGNMVMGGGCSGSCGSGCGNIVMNGGCSGSCGSGCGNIVMSGGCSGSCGSGCGNMVMSGGCSGSCGSGCGNIVMSGGCSGSCGSGCGNMVTDGGGSMVESSGCKGGGSCAGSCSN